MHRIVFTAIVLSMLPFTSNAAEPGPKPIESKNDKIVCKVEREPGTRIGGKKVCRTASEWRVVSEDYRRELRRWQASGGGTNGQ